MLEVFVPMILPIKELLVATVLIVSAVYPRYIFHNLPEVDGKVIAVLELLILQSRGKLSLDDTAVQYFPELKISQDITLEMLASQISGLGRDGTINPVLSINATDYLNGRCGHAGFGGCTVQDFFNVLDTHPPSFEPETQPACTSSVAVRANLDSNDGFTLLGLIIEKAHGT